MKTLLLAALLGQFVQPYLGIQDEGGQVWYPFYLNLTGPGISCTRSGSKVTCDVSGQAQSAAVCTTLDGVWIGASAPANPVTYAVWQVNGHVGYWGWINTAP